MKKLTLITLFGLIVACNNDVSKTPNHEQDGLKLIGNESTTIETNIDAKEIAPENQRNAPPGFAEVAKRLGVTEEAFFKAMSDAGGRNADINDVANALGVTVEELKSALPKPPKEKSNQDNKK